VGEGQNEASVRASEFYIIENKMDRDYMYDQDGDLSCLRTPYTVKQCAMFVISHLCESSIYDCGSQVAYFQL